MHFCTLREKTPRQFIEIAKAIVRMFCIVVCHTRNLHYRIECCWGWKSAMLWWKKSSMLIPLNTLSYSFTVPFHRLVASQRSGYFCNMHMHEHRRLNFPLLDKQIKERVHRHKKKTKSNKISSIFSAVHFSGGLFAVILVAVQTRLSQLFPLHSVDRYIHIQPFFVFVAGGLQSSPNGRMIEWEPDRRWISQFLFVCHRILMSFLMASKKYSWRALLPCRAIHIWANRRARPGRESKTNTRTRLPMLPEQIEEMAEKGIELIEEKKKRIIVLPFFMTISIVNGFDFRFFMSAMNIDDNRRLQKNTHESRFRLPSPKSLFRREWIRTFKLEIYLLSFFFCGKAKKTAPTLMTACGYAITNSYMPSFYTEMDIKMQ